jgi:hypothetical protein
VSLAAQSADVSSDVSSGEAQAAVTPVEDWQLLEDTCNFLDGVFLPRLTAAALPVVSDVLTALQGCAEHATKNKCSKDAQCTVVLRVTLQEAYDNNTVLLQEAKLISEWIKQHYRNATVARQHLNMVSYNFTPAAIAHSLHCLCLHVTLSYAALQLQYASSSAAV